MEIDLDPILNAVHPWELNLKIGGKVFSVRRLTNSDMKRLGDAEKHSEKSNRQFLTSLFDGNPSEPGEWGADRLSAVIAAIGTYYQEAVVRPNSVAAATAVASAIGSSS